MPAESSSTHTKSHARRNADRHREAVAALGRRAPLGRPSTGRIEDSAAVRSPGQSGRASRQSSEVDGSHALRPDSITGGFDEPATRGSPEGSVRLHDSDTAAVQLSAADVLVRAVAGRKGTPTLRSRATISRRALTCSTVARRTNESSNAHLRFTSTEPSSTISPTPSGSIARSWEHVAAAGARDHALVSLQALNGLMCLRSGRRSHRGGRLATRTV